MTRSQFAGFVFCVIAGYILGGWYGVALGIVAFLVLNSE